MPAKKPDLKVVPPGVDIEALEKDVVEFAEEQQPVLSRADARRKEAEVELSEKRAERAALVASKQLAQSRFDALLSAYEWHISDIDAVIAQIVGGIGGQE